MRIVIAGAGGIGFFLAKRLTFEKAHLTVIDDDAERCASVQSLIDVAVIQGSVTSREILKEAGVASADVFVAVTASDEVNILACLLASRMGARQRIARVRSTDYFEKDSLLKPQDVGVDMFIRPEREAVAKIVRLLMRSAASDIVEFEDGKLVLVGLKLDDSCPYLDAALKDIGTEDQRKLYRVVAILRDGRTLIPGGGDALRKNDEIFTIIRRERLRSFQKLMGKSDQKLDKIVILGGGLIGCTLAEQLESKGIHVILVEMDRAKSVEVANRLEKTTVIHVEGTVIETLESEGILDTDAFVAATADDETNIISCLLAKRHGIQKAIALVNRENYLSLMPAIGIDATVNERVSAANAILRFIRRGEIRMMASIGDIDAELIEFEVGAGSGLTGRPLSRLPLPAGSVIASIVRGDDVLVPSGETTLEPADRAIVFMLPKAAAAVKKLFLK